MQARTLFVGILLWAVGTIAIRFLGRGLLHANQTSKTVILYLASFLLMALFSRRILYRLGVDRDSWLKAVGFLILPTLVLDPFSCAFFTTVFPNLDPGAAGVFGGWMLICCGGALAGVSVKS